MRKAQKLQIEETIRQMEEAHGEMKRCIEKGLPHRWRNFW